MILVFAQNKNNLHFWHVSALALIIELNDFKIIFEIRYLEKWKFGLSFLRTWLLHQLSPMQYFPSHIVSGSLVIIKFCIQWLVWISSNIYPLIHLSWKGILEWFQNFNRIFRMSPIMCLRLMTIYKRIIFSIACLLEMLQWSCIEVSACFSNIATRMFQIILECSRLF